MKKVIFFLFVGLLVAGNIQAQKSFETNILKDEYMNVSLRFEGFTLIKKGTETAERGLGGKAVGLQPIYYSSKGFMYTGMINVGFDKYHYIYFGAGYGYNFLRRKRIQIPIFILGGLGGFWKKDIPENNIRRNGNIMPFDIAIAPGINYWVSNRLAITTQYHHGTHKKAFSVGIRFY